MTASAERALVIAELRTRWRSIAALSGGCFVLLITLCGTYSAYGGISAFSNAFGSGHAPRLFSAVSGSQNADIFQPRNYLAFGFDHPLFLVFALGIAITSGVGGIAADVETGRAELLYTAPIRRTVVFRARLSAWAVAQAAVVAGAAAGALVGARLAADLAGVPLAVPFRVLAQFVPLAFVAAAAGFAASARASTRSGALGIAVGAVAGSYVINLIALLWSRVAVLQHANPFGYYSPTDAARSVNWLDAGVLLGAGVLLLLLARHWLLNRDLV